MKYVFVILDGAVDRPLKELENRTPLIAAAGENLKAMARKPRIGAVQPLPPDWAPARGAYRTEGGAGPRVVIMGDGGGARAVHPFTGRRGEGGRPPGDMAWPWSPGRPPQLEAFGPRHGVGGACVAGEGMVKGL